MNERNREYKLPETLRMLMRRHPVTKGKTTQKELASFLGIRPQSLSQYCTGESIPNGKTILKMAEYFGVSADYLLIGYEDGDLYFAMEQALRKRIYERLGHIAVLCSQAENEALYMMAHEVNDDVQE